MNTLHVVGAALLRDGLCLVAQRGPQMSLPGKWEFPGGKLEEGETPAQALARELAEELGVEVEVGAFLGRGTAPVGARTVQLDVYLANLVRGEPRPHEHSALRWVSARALADLDWAAADIPIVSAVQAHMQR